MMQEIKPWRPKRTYKDVLYEYGNEITTVECNDDQILVTVKLVYDEMPEDVGETDLQILVNKLNENGGTFSIVPRAKFQNT